MVDRIGFGIEHLHVSVPFRVLGYGQPDLNQFPLPSTIYCAQPFSFKERAPEQSPNDFAQKHGSRATFPISIFGDRSGECLFRQVFRNVVGNSSGCVMRTILGKQRKGCRSELTQCMASSGHVISYGTNRRNLLQSSKDTGILDR